LVILRPGFHSDDTEISMQVQSLDHLSIGTSKLEETRAFFCDVLGFTVGLRPKLKSNGYWLYSNDRALVHLVEAAGKEGPNGAASADDMVETGMDDHIAMTISGSADVVTEMTDKGIAYWDRLLADRNLYQVFVRDPNGVVIELNDYDPDHSRIKPMAVQGRN
jgi:catechol 2,3-dioxygenase-like lactoylglutathione lyase family enzyme